MYAGQKIEIEVTMVDRKSRKIIDRHGYLNGFAKEYTFKGLDGTTYTHTTTACVVGLYGVEPGETFKMKATVKEVTDTEVKLIRCRKA